MTKHAKQTDEESIAAEEQPATETAPHWSKAQEKVAPLPADHVKNALAHNEPLAALTALAALHGAESVKTEAQKHVEDPNYGANAKAWLALKT